MQQIPQLDERLARIRDELDAIQESCRGAPAETGTPDGSTTRKGHLRRLLRRVESEVEKVHASVQGVGRALDTLAILASLTARALGVTPELPEARTAPSEAQTDEERSRSTSPEG